MQNNIRPKICDDIADRGEAEQHLACRLENARGKEVQNDIAEQGDVREHQAQQNHEIEVPVSEVDMDQFDHEQGWGSARAALTEVPVVSEREKSIEHQLFDLASETLAEPGEFATPGLSKSQWQHGCIEEPSEGHEEEHDEEPDAEVLFQDTTEALFQVTTGAAKSRSHSEQSLEEEATILRHECGEARARDEEPDAEVLFQITTEVLFQVTTVAVKSRSHREQSLEEVAIVLRHECGEARARCALTVKHLFRNAAHHCQHVHVTEPRVSVVQGFRPSFNESLSPEAHVEP